MESVEFDCQKDDSSGIATVLISNQLLNIRNVFLERGSFVVVFGFVKLLESFSHCAVVALDVNMEKEPIASLLVELEAIRYYRQHYFPKLFSNQKTRRSPENSWAVALEEISRVIQKNHGMTFGAIQRTFSSFSKEQLSHLLLKLVDEFSIYKHGDAYFPL